jgi:hypothetical protein
MRACKKMTIKRRRNKWVVEGDFDRMASGRGNVLGGGISEAGTFKLRHE